MPAKKSASRSTSTRDTRKNAPKAQKAPAQPETKPAEGHVAEPATVSETGRAPAAPDSGDTPMNYDARGDAHPLTFDPLLNPDSQQPGEREEDWRKRTGRPLQP